MEYERVFLELIPEVDITAQMYAVGKEKKEITGLKNRVLATINGQIQKAFELLEVRNGRELSILYATWKARVIISVFFLVLMGIDIYYEAETYCNRHR